MAKSDSTVAPVNPLIDQSNPFDTLHHVRGVLSFISFTAPTLISDGSNNQATHGLSMVLECVEQAFDHATLILAQTKGAHHG